MSAETIFARGRTNLNGPQKSYGPILEVAAQSRLAHWISGPIFIIRSFRSELRMKWGEWGLWWRQRLSLQLMKTVAGPAMAEEEAEVTGGGASVAPHRSAGESHPSWEGTPGIRASCPSRPSPSLLSSSAALPPLPSLHSRPPESARSDFFFLTETSLHSRSFSCSMFISVSHCSWISISFRSELGLCKR